QRTTLLFPAPSPSVVSTPAETFPLFILLTQSRFCSACNCASSFQGDLKFSYTSMGEAERAYAVFDSKVTRTVYLDNLSPQATEAVIKSAIEQYGTVIKVQLIPNYAEPILKSCSALVELAKAKQAVHVVNILSSYPFMILGMPRPIRVCHAEEEMFADRPPKPGRKIKICWLKPVDEDFKVARKLKKMAKKHLAEFAYLLKHQSEEEEKLAKTQAKTLKRAYMYHAMMEENLNTRLLNRMKKCYTDNTGN
ncbi:hypothetical protein V2J09_002353, partial [Rumex salicifolius]